MLLIYTSLLPVIAYKGVGKTLVNVVYVPTLEKLISWFWFLAMGLADVFLSQVA